MKSCYLTKLYFQLQYKYLEGQKLSTSYNSGKFCAFKKNRI
jgi:hypothetical protein